MNRSLVYHSGFTPPLLHFRLVPPTPLALPGTPSSTPFTQIPMDCIGGGRIPQERCWIARDLGTGAQAIEFYLTDSGGKERDPARGSYRTHLTFSFLQDGDLYSYWPAPKVAPARRDYDTSAPPQLKSKYLREARPYRVFLPRGYQQHPERRYPVLYLKDGQNVFEQGPFGSWEAASKVAHLTARGDTRELIVVAIDNTPSRLSDYVAPDDGGKADRYAAFVCDELKPLVDANYRTLPEARHTGVLGSSAGGVAALYLGWEHPNYFGRVGAMSGSWWLRQFPTRIRREPPRALRLYLDSGDTGGRWKDGLEATRQLHKDLIRKGMDDLYYTVGQGHGHNEWAWGERLPMALSYLYPAREEEPRVSEWVRLRQRPVQKANSC